MSDGAVGMNTLAGADANEAFDRLLAALRPKLHRYCARMTGSVIDGEDVVQEALMKAIEGYRAAPAIAQPEAWLFRVAHNAALDFLRRRARQEAIRSDEQPDSVADPVSTIDDQHIAATSLRTFMRLPVAQRSSVILMDVLGYSLDEIGAVIDTTIPAVKAALHRGRSRLRELAAEPEDRPIPVLPEHQRALLSAYVDRFNARDFDAVRDMLADEVRLELVAKARMNGKSAVSKYFQNYGSVQDWHFVPGFVDGRHAAIVRNPKAGETPADLVLQKPACAGVTPADAARKPTYFVVIEWAGDRVAHIRDFRHARYAMADAEVIVGA
jgi:RNA polymerase sigma-70 factor (ECF subfamily)